MVIDSSNKRELGQTSNARHDGTTTTGAPPRSTATSQRGAIWDGDREKWVATYVSPHDGAKLFVGGDTKLEAEQKCNAAYTEEVLSVPKRPKKRRRTEEEAQRRRRRRCPREELPPWHQRGPRTRPFRLEAHL